MKTFVDRMEQVSGGRLRMVVRLESVDFELEYVRDDLEGKFSDERLEKAYQAVMANMVSTQDFTRFADGRGLESEIYVLERKIVFVFPSSRYEGLFVSFDRDDSLSLLAINSAAREFDRVHADDGEQES